MARAEYDEKHWYGYGGWRQLYADLRKVAAIEAPSLLEALAQPEPDVRTLVTAFVERIVRTLRKRQTPGGTTKWIYGISLLGETEMLISLIEKDTLLNGNQGHRNTPLDAAFWVIFPRFLNRARQKQGGTSSHRVVVWEMMDRISRRVVEEHAKAGRNVNRMSIEHILEVQSRCLEKWPTNTNVNVDIPTFRGYFEEFCEDAREAYVPDTIPTSVDRYQNLILDTEISPAARVCLDRLSRQDQGLWDALLVKLELHPRITLSSAPYAASLSISRYEVDQRYTAAVTFMAKCVQASLDFFLRS